MLLLESMNKININICNCTEFNETVNRSIGENMDIQEYLLIIKVTLAVAEHPSVTGSVSGLASH